MHRALELSFQRNLFVSPLSDFREIASTFASIFLKLEMSYLSLSDFCILEFQPVSM